MVFEPRVLSTRQLIMGRWDSDNKYFYALEQTQQTNSLTTHGTGWTRETATVPTAVVGTKYTYVWDWFEKAITFNGELFATFTGKPNASGGTLWLFASNDVGSPLAYSYVRLYSLKIWRDTGELISEYVPTVRLSDGALGLYDLESDTFKTRLGSGTFAYAIPIYPEINIVGAGTITGTGDYANGDPVTLTAVANSGFEFVNWTVHGYTKLDYIESSGTQYINTGYAPRQFFKAEVDFALATNGYVDDSLLSLTNNNNTAFRSEIYVSSTNKVVSWNSSSGNIGTLSKVLSVGERTQITFTQTSSSQTIADNSETKTKSVTTANNSYCYLLSYYGNGRYYGKYRIYGCKIYNGDTLVRDFIPAKRNYDGTLGLFDLLSFKFYTNVGTGTFTYGQELGDIEIEDNPLMFSTEYVTSLTANFKRTANCQFKLNGEWKYGMMYKKVNGEWVTGSVYTKVNGNWETLSNPQTRMLNMALSTVLGNDVSVKDPNVALNIIMKGE